MIYIYRRIFIRWTLFFGYLVSVQLHFLLATYWKLLDPNLNSVIVHTLTSLVLKCNYMQESSMEAVIRWSHRNIHRHLWNPQVQFYVHKTLLPVHILCQINPIHTLYTNSLKSIILSPSSGSSKSLPLRFSNWNFIFISRRSYALHPSPI